MPNGRPGDRPDTDIIVHELNVYDDPEINEMIREIERRTKHGFRKHTNINLYSKEYGWKLSEEQQQKLKKELKSAIEDLNEEP